MINLYTCAYTYMSKLQKELPCKAENNEEPKRDLYTCTSTPEGPTLACLAFVSFGLCGFELFVLFVVSVASAAIGFWWLVWHCVGLVFDCLLLAVLLDFDG